MERDCESELSKLNIEQNACIYHFGASVIHGQRSNILRLPESQTLRKDTRVGQLVITPVLIADFVLDFREARDNGAFGSTGE